ncbi:hypothetical protein AQUCO_01200281v1 [Aquilegia coerulea]|uniref:Histone acetyltransferase n=1 Tax=Aquilegia coerulea TaxID=218851 RepID=A0A2G5E553_AQUCA|nr:hypothetical protein AQUCO_01200281v1 [Aquilegia coerulea]
MPPRQGQKPYECIRKAWHNDKHQSMRGSIIQEIFRVVSEIHSSQTKKNNEWMRKLPIVVLKVEEIMYSKADSEMEYMDLQTLWERTNDAINTIIRREESTETGDLLQPCIEAALILGCTARRGSRSQRYSRSYLNNNTQESNSVSPGFVDNMINGRSSCLPPLGHSSKPSSTSLSIPYCSAPAIPVTTKSIQLQMETGTPHTDGINAPSISYALPFFSEYMPPPSSRYQPSSIESHSSNNLGRAYPLYYGAHHQPADSQAAFRGTNFSRKCQVKSIHYEKGFLQKISTCNEDVDTSNRITEGGEIRNIDEVRPEIHECDLSLHLGPLTVCKSRNQVQTRS